MLNVAKEKRKSWSHRKNERYHSQSFGWCSKSPSKFHLALQEAKLPHMYTKETRYHAISWKCQTTILFLQVSTFVYRVYWCGSIKRRLLFFFTASLKLWLSLSNAVHVFWINQIQLFKELCQSENELPVSLRKTSRLCYIFHSKTCDHKFVHQGFLKSETAGLSLR